MHTSKTHYGGNFTCSCVYAKCTVWYVKVGVASFILVVAIATHTKNVCLELSISVGLYSVHRIHPIVRWTQGKTLLHIVSHWLCMCEYGDVALKIQLSYRNHDRIWEFILIGCDTFEFLMNFWCWQLLPLWFLFNACTVSGWSRLDIDIQFDFWLMESELMQNIHTRFSLSLSYSSSRIKSFSYL